MRQKPDHVIVKHPFDLQKEKKRKENLAKLFMRTKSDNEEEKSMLVELKKLDMLIKKTEKEEKQLEKLVKNETLRQAALVQQQAILANKLQGTPNIIAPLKA